MNGLENTPVLVAHADAARQAEFYRKTYSNVAFGVLAFIGIEAVLLKIDPLVNLMLSLQGYSWLLLLGGFMAVTWVAQNLTYRNADRTKQYAGFLLYILAEAIIFVPLLYLAMNFGGGPQMIAQAGVITGTLFLGLTAAVLMTKTDFSFLRTGLVVGFFIALGLIVAGTVFGFNLGLWFSVGMVLLAAGSILYSTYQIKNEFGTDQYVPAALSLFASLMLLFWYVLQILMSRR
ncbi:MAG: Bax inhibitor-1 family protein [Flavobacteriia bacterium]|nr:Bax inhibitor-1 family protein [Flavobacteriia bacterium]